MMNEDVKNILELAYVKYKGDVYSMALHILMDKASAEDVVQETFFKYGSELQKGKEIKSEKYWLLKVAWNRSIDFKRYVKKFVDDNLLRYMGLNKDIENVELSNEVKELLKGLKIEERSLLVLKYIQDLKYEEISEVLKMPVGTVKTKINRIIQKING